MTYPNYPYINPQYTQNVQQNNGLVSVRNEAEARAYPIAPGHSITFKDETAPYIYTKTMGFSQLDRPMFEKFKLIKEETPTEPQEQAQKSVDIDLSIYATKEEIEAVLSDLAAIRKELAEIRDNRPIGGNKHERK